LGMLGIVLGLPPQLVTDSDNLVVLATYFVVIMVGVWYLLKRSDKLYANLYGRMTDAEIKSIRIERDLGDPARLLNDLADDGLDFGAMLGEASSGSSSSGMPASPSPSSDAEKEPLGELDFNLSTEVDADV